jgi:transforming growth factor-beta-induced protein
LQSAAWWVRLLQAVLKNISRALRLLSQELMMTQWIRMRWLVASSTFALLAACGGGGSDTPAPVAPVANGNLAQVAQAEGNLGKMVQAADAAGMMPSMQGQEALTFLAPSDDAMAEIAEEMGDLMQPANRERLTEFMKAHMVPSKMLAEQMGAAATTGSGTVTNLLGESLSLGMDAGTLTINGAKAQKTNVNASNGVIHVFSAPIWRPTVFGIVRAIPQLDTLEAAIRAAGLQDVLRRHESRYTLFAPTNRAFERLLSELRLTADQLLANKPLLTQVLTYHVLASRVFSFQIDDDSTAATVQGQSIAFDVSGPRFFPTITLTDARGRDAKVTFPNLAARNGVVHLIDRVILPQGQNLVELAVANPQFSILVEAVLAAGLAETLSSPGPFTVFAPTNDAFAKLLGELNVSKEALLANKPLLTSVLTYHVLGGRVLAGDIQDNSTPATVQGQAIRLDTDGGKVVITDAAGRKSNVVATNVQASNGVIHVIDTVILPQSKNIVEIAVGLPDFSILVEAVLAAELQGVLSGPGPFTVFAPTNEAFAALLGELNVSKEALLANKALLTAVLTYHVLPARVLAADIRDNSSAHTVQGQTIRLDTDGGKVRITDGRNRVSNVVATDVQAANGVIHVIDKVILPRP